MDISRPIQTQLSAVHNNNDIRWYPNSAKAVKDNKKVLPFRKHEYNYTRIQFQTNADGALAFMGNFLCGLESSGVTRGLIQVGQCSPKWSPLTKIQKKIKK